MERKQYLDSCQRATMSSGATVKYNGAEYIPTAYQLSYDKTGSVLHTAVLKDINANSLIACRLSDVE